MRSFLHLMKTYFNLILFYHVGFNSEGFLLNFSTLSSPLTMIYYMNLFPRRGIVDLISSYPPVICDNCIPYSLEHPLYLYPLCMRNKKVKCKNLTLKLI